MVLRVVLDLDGLQRRCWQHLVVGSQVVVVVGLLVALVVGLVLQVGLLLEVVGLLGREVVVVLLAADLVVVGLLVPLVEVAGPMVLNGNR